MGVFAVSYDLRKPGRNYQPLWERLAAWKAVRALESFWLIDAECSAGQIRDDLRGYIDSNDGLFVGRLTGETAWHNLLGQSDQFLRRQFARA